MGWVPMPVTQPLNGRRGALGLRFVFDTIRLRLTGPAGGRWSSAGDGPELDAVEFCRTISRRAPARACWTSRSVLRSAPYRDYRLSGAGRQDGGGVVGSMRGIWVGDGERPADLGA
jgi:hypothetical protein